jgi:hypothetical protein
MLVLLDGVKNKIARVGATLNCQKETLYGLECEIVPVFVAYRMK